MWFNKPNFQIYIQVFKGMPATFCENRVFIIISKGYDSINKKTLINIDCYIYLHSFTY